MVWGASGTLGNFGLEYRLQVASRSQDMTILVWNTELWRVRADPHEPKLTPRGVAGLWYDLAVVKGDRGYRTIVRLSLAPRESAAMVRMELRTTTPPAPPMLPPLPALVSSRLTVNLSWMTPPLP